MARGYFITFEGGEGAGKTTQADLLTERLRGKRIDVFRTREPGGTPRAEAIRDVLLSGKAKALGPLGEAVLFYAARESHLELAIRPALAKGTWVVCDRFSDSTRAYQGAGGGVSMGTLAALESAVVGATKPDLTILIDLPPEIGLRRAAARASARHDGSAADRFESMNLAFHQALRDEFLALAEAEPNRIAVIDGRLPVDQVAEQIWSGVRQRFGV